MVESVYQTNRRDHFRVKCRCDCGSLIDTTSGSLRGGSNKSCGCYRRDRAGNLYRKHGLSQTTRYCMFYDARKRALLRGVPFKITPDDIVIPETCPVLGIPIGDFGTRDNRPSLDRVVPTLGYVVGNIHVISFRANRIKSDASPDELRAVLAYVERA